MSSLTNTYISEVHASLNVTYLETAVLALFLYDFLLTLPLEVSYIWRTKFRLSTLYYIAMRYPPMAQLLFDVAANETTPQYDCDLILISTGVLSVVARAGIVATLTSRTYAFCTFQRQCIVIIGICFLAVVTIALEFAQIFTLSCDASVNKDKTAHWLAAIVTSRSAFEGVVVFVTIFKTLPTVKLQTGLKQFNGKSFMLLIFKSEIIYFTTVFIVEMTNAIYFAASFQSVSQDTNISGILSLPISTILISRFLLDLRAANSPDPSVTLSHTTSTLHFASKQCVCLDRPDVFPSRGHEVNSSQFIEPDFAWKMASKVELGSGGASQHLRDST